MKTFLLSDICQIEIGRTPARANPLFWEGEHPWLSIADMGKHKDIYTTKERITDLGAKTFNGRIVDPGTLLFSFKLSIGKIGIAKVPLYTNEAIAALRIKDKSLTCEEYLYYALQGLNLDTKTDRAVMGKTLNKRKLSQINIPLPPLEEQKRIAAILDKAETIRGKRKEAIALTEELLRSTFLDMFGDPVTNPKGWEKVTFAEIIKGKMRNGLSPSSKGTHQGQVLTLSAITQGSFDISQRKIANFDISPPKDKMLYESDLLVCRGNGNINLVGCGRFPDAEYLNTMFPDTIIGVPIDCKIIDRNFLETLWNSPFIRRQIEKKARTTNGTYKINQTILSGIQLVLPPLKLQTKFSSIYQALMAMNRKFNPPLFDDLFNSLLQKSFRGEL